MTIKNGWHIIKGQKVLVENGCIMRGVKPSPFSSGEIPTYPYVYSEKYGCWLIADGVEIDTFCNGNYKMQ